MTTSYKEFLRKPSNGKRQKFGLGGGLYGGIEPTKKGGGHFLFWKNSKYEKRLGSIPRINEKKARRTVIQIQDWIAKGNHPKLFGKTSQKYFSTFSFIFPFKVFEFCIRTYSGNCLIEKLILVV